MHMLSPKPLTTVSCDHPKRPQKRNQSLVKCLLYLLLNICYLNMQKTRPSPLEYTHFLTAVSELFFPILFIFPKIAT